MPVPWMPGGAEARQEGNGKNGRRHQEMTSRCYHRLMQLGWAARDAPLVPVLKFHLDAVTLSPSHFSHFLVCIFNWFLYFFHLENFQATLFRAGNV